MDIDMSALRAIERERDLRLDVLVEAIEQATAEAGHARLLAAVVARGGGVGGHGVDPRRSRFHAHRTASISRAPSSTATSGPQKGAADVIALMVASVCA